MARREIFDLAMLFVEGRAPRFLEQWYVGGTLIGLWKDDKPLVEDARPIVVGELSGELPVRLR